MRLHKGILALLMLSALVCANLWSQTEAPAGAPTASGQSTTSSQAGSTASNPAQSPPATTASSTPSWTTVGRVNFSAMVDGYYSFNNNHPNSDFNALYNFNDKTNQVDL